VNGVERGEGHDGCLGRSEIQRNLRVVAEEDISLGDHQWEQWVGEVDQSI